METHAFGFRLRANAPEGQKRFPISNKREEELKQKIEEVKRRFPYHSVQPYLVQELEELEQELSEIRKQKNK